MSTGIGGTSESHESRAGVGALISGFHVYDHADHEGGNNGRSGGNGPSRCAAAASCALPSSMPCACERGRTHAEYLPNVENVYVSAPHTARHRRGAYPWSTVFANLARAVAIAAGKLVFARGR